MDKQSLIRKAIKTAIREYTLTYNDTFSIFFLEDKQEWYWNTVRKHFLKDYDNEEIVAILDTTVLNSGKEGVVFTEKGIYSNKFMRNESTFGKPLSPLYYKHLSLFKNGITKDTESYADFTYNDAPYNVYNSIFSKQFTMIINTIISYLYPYHVFEIKPPYPILLEKMDNESDDFKNDRFAYFYIINKIYSALKITYEPKIVDDPRYIEVRHIIASSGLFEKFLEDDTCNKAYYLLKNGYAQYMCFIKERSNTYKQAETLSILLDLAYELDSFDDNVEFLKNAALCYMLLYSYHKIDILSDLANTLVRIAELVEEKERNELYELLSIFFDILVQRDHIKEFDKMDISNKLGNYFFEKGSRENSSIAYKKAIQYNHKEAYIALAKLFKTDNPDGSAMLIREYDILSATHDIITTPKNINEEFDRVCALYIDGDDEEFAETLEDLAESGEKKIQNACKYNLALYNILYAFDDYDKNEAYQDMEALANIGLKQAKLFLAISTFENLYDYSKEKAFKYLEEVNDLNPGVCAYYKKICYEKGLGTKEKVKLAFKYKDEYIAYYKKCVQEL